MRGAAIAQINRIRCALCLGLFASASEYLGHNCDHGRRARHAVAYFGRAAKGDELATETTDTRS